MKGETRELSVLNAKEMLNCSCCYCRWFEDTHSLTHEIQQREKTKLEKVRMSSTLVFFSCFLLWMHVREENLTQILEDAQWIFFKLDLPIDFFCLFIMENCILSAGVCCSIHTF